MNRDLKEEQRPDAPVDAEAPAEPTQLNPLLIPLTEEQQEELVAIVLEDERNAEEARNKTDWGTSKNGESLTFDKKMAELFELYEGATVSRDEKWMCGRSLKIAQGIVEMLVARLYPAVMNEDSMRWRPVRDTSKQYVQDVNRLMEWVLLTWMKVRHDILMYCRHGISLGTVIAEPYWSVERRDTGKKETIQVSDEMGMPVMDEMGQPMTIEQKMLETDEKPAVRLIPITKFLTQPGSKDIKKDPVIIVEEYKYHELEALAKQGLMMNVLEKLKENVDTRVLKESDKVLEEAENIADSNAKRRQMPIPCLREYLTYDYDGDGFAEDIIVLVAKTDKVLLRAYPVHGISRTGKRQLVQANFIDRIDKLLGIGVLEQVKPLAEEIDACFRQLQDANTLSIMKWGFYDPNSDYDPAEHVAKPRAMYPVSNPSQNVYFPDMNIPIERLLNAIRLVSEFIEKLTAASSYVMGKESDIVGGSGTATRTNAIVSAADTRFNLPATNLRDGVAEIFTEIFNLCAMNMPKGLEEKILGENHEKVFKDSEAFQAALATEMECYLIPPPDMGDTNTRRQLAVMLYDKLIGGMNPLVVQDPNRIWWVTANFLSAYGENPREIIGKPASMKGTNDPSEENVLIRDGHTCLPEPQENHLEHIMVHQQATQGPNILMWPAETRQYLQQHIMGHQQMMQQMMSFGAQGGKGGKSNGAEAAPAQPGGDSAQKGGVAMSNGQPDIQAAPSQATGTPEQQSSGSTHGGV